MRPYVTTPLSAMALAAILIVAGCGGGQQQNIEPQETAAAPAGSAAAVPEAAPPAGVPAAGSAMSAAPAQSAQTSPRPAETMRAPAPGSSAAASAPPVAAAPPPPPAEPPPPPKPEFEEVTIPTGTTLQLRLTTEVSSATSKVEDPVKATLASAIKVKDTTALPSGAVVSGTILSAAQSGKVKGLAEVEMRFSSVRAHDTTYEIGTVKVTQTAESTKKQDAKKVGIGAGAGALIGAIAGGGKGAAIGTAIGGGAGAGAVMATKGKEVELPVGTVVTTTLTAPLTVRVPLN